MTELIDISEGGTCLAPTLGAGELLLRPCRSEDYATLRSHRSDPEIYRYIRPPEPEEKTQAVFEQLLTPWAFSEFRWNGLMVSSSTQPDTCLGEIVFNVANAHSRHIELGYLIDPSCAGQGLATRASALLIGWLFTHTNCHKIVAHVDPRNKASVRVLEKLKMRLEAQFASHYRNGDSWNDEWMFGLLRSDYLFRS